MKRSAPYALCLVFCLAWIFLPRVPLAEAQQAGKSQLFALVAPGQNQGQNVLFVIDPHTTQLAVYEHRANGPLELRMVRNLEHDLRFDEWPLPRLKRQSPSVKDMLP